MKITVLGSLGNISKPLAEKLVKAGHQVTVISSSDDRVEAIEALGAKAAIGSVDDVPFLIEAFKGADAVYTMVPPNFGANAYVEYIAQVGRNYAEAVRASGVGKVVNLSSVGADLASGTGPIAGLYNVEQSLNGVKDLSVKHLRAGFFFTNFYGNIDMIRHANMMGGNYGGDVSLLMVHPSDIADAAAEEFGSGFSGQSVRYVVSDERKMTEVTSALGAAIGKPDLKWTEFTDQQSLDGMEKAGMPKSIAETFTEMGSALRSGALFADYKKSNVQPSGRVKLADFAVEFAGKY